MGPVRVTGLQGLGLRVSGGACRVTKRFQGLGFTVSGLGLRNSNLFVGLRVFRV